MSKVIKKLVKENHSAYLWHCLRNDIEFKGDTYLIKLAEAVALECAKFVGKQRNDIPACGFEFEAAIRQHFGVEHYK